MTSPQHCLLVCTACAGNWENGREIGNSGGTELLQQLQAKHQNWELAAEFPLRAVSCMNACNRACAIAFAGTGKNTYLFGDIPPGISPTTIDNILSCAQNYYQHPDGSLPWAERPAPLKKGVLGKIPPVFLAS